MVASWWTMFVRPAFALHKLPAHILHNGSRQTADYWLMSSARITLDRRMSLVSSLLTITPNYVLKCITALCLNIVPAYFP
jgi:hypothetical protein